MGMFDSLYADRSRTGYDDEWQTKAYWCALDRYFIGDEMPPYWLTPQNKKKPPPR